DRRKVRDSEVRARSEPIKKSLRDRRVALVRLVVGLDLDTLQPPVEEIRNGIAAQLLSRGQLVNLADYLAGGALNKHSAAGIKGGRFELVGNLLSDPAVGRAGRFLHPASVDPTKTRIPEAT